ncbi:MAG: hypothetical protein LBU66_06375 [Treponema sp.]|jgi:hypothetical protein|nr:hypothetical protein [Treponema sp.]
MKLLKTNPVLRITIIAGLILFVLTCASIAVFYLVERNSTKTARLHDSFARNLREYDLQALEIFGTGREIEHLSRELDKLEKSAIGVEAWLSVLKRRRALANRYGYSGYENSYPEVIEKYRISLDNALKTWEHSEPVAALAAEAIVKNAAINKEAEERLRNLLVSISDSEYNNLRLSLHVLLGDFKNAQRASAIPAMRVNPFELFHDGTESIVINFAILKILNGDIRGGASDIQSALYSIPLSDELLYFTAEFFYDFGSLQRSAEIFSYIDSDKAKSREADALYLAGFEDSARAIWRLLSNEPLSENASAHRSLYNLAITSNDNAESFSYLEKLYNTPESESSAARQFGVIRYSRLLDLPHAISSLQTASNNPFIDLELVKRQSEEWRLGRQTAETWMLLDRHPDNEDLHQWAAWFFLFQRNYSELKILLSRSEMNNFGEWVKNTKAILSMFEGDLESAEETLRSIPDAALASEDWLAHANLGRIFEAYASPSRALEQYNLAVEKAPNPKTAAKLQLRIARCYNALNRPIDSIIALQYAITLDSENLNARMELDRMLLD